MTEQDRKDMRDMASTLADLIRWTAPYNGQWKAEFAAMVAIMERHSREMAR